MQKQQNQINWDILVKEDLKKRAVLQSKIEKIDTQIANKLKTAKTISNLKQFTKKSNRLTKE